MSVDKEKVGNKSYKQMEKNVESKSKSYNQKEEDIGKQKQVISVDGGRLWETKASHISRWRKTLKTKASHITRWRKTLGNKSKSYLQMEEDFGKQKQVI
ncbi:hypothetical protein CDAR_530421 [Caerostris darwini]|uniref:Uncharacterized protein n=1 Tax=Caerostris darwini TaxID=1538125 RepID=A0AAV4NJP2_9ARAC|nr:hypothetical protein CDAR_530421 [Caerostris darwini]